MVKKHHYITKALFTVAALVIFGLSVVRAGPVTITTTATFTPAGACAACPVVAGPPLSSITSGSAPAISVIQYTSPQTTLTATGPGAVIGNFVALSSAGSPQSFNGASVALSIDAINGSLINGGPVTIATGALSGGISSTSSNAQVSWTASLPISFTTMAGNTYTLTALLSPTAINHVGSGVSIGAITGTLDLTGTPEPTTLLLFGSGIAIAGYLKRRRKLGGDSGGLA